MTQLRHSSPHALGSSTSGHLALTLAKDEVDDCVCGHERCRALTPSPQSAPLPTCLIDCSDPERPHLATTAGRIGAYLARSYAWGEEQPHRTTIANLSTYEEGIDPRELPQTIRDAIHVTRSLAFHLLWADTLCIIQDSSADKHREMAHMRSIYRNVYVMIIAASASKVSEGFLQDRWLRSRNHVLHFPCPPRPGADSHPCKEADQDMRRIGTIYLEEHCSLMPWDNPIHQRGWCLQELLMSPRAHIFLSKTLAFKCQETIAGVHKVVHAKWGDAPPLPDVLLHPDAPPHLLHHETWSEVWRVWRSVVVQYSSRSITVSSDKLIACAGMAEEFHRVLGSDYLAGLWRDSLLYDILWCSPPLPMLPSPPNHPTDYRAPAWSWASLDVPIDYNMIPPHRPSPSDDAAELVECKIQLADLDYMLPFGEVVGGSLILRAPLVQCCLANGSVPSHVEPGLSLIVPPRSEHRFQEKAGEEAVVDECCSYELKTFGHATLDDPNDPEPMAFKWWAALIMRYRLQLSHAGGGLLLVLDVRPDIDSGASESRSGRAVFGASGVSLFRNIEI